jgi:signal transduction histidine kinase
MGEAIEQRDAQLERQQNDRLQQARLATVGRLTAQITHELRNPLSSIGLNADLLEEELVELSTAIAELEEGTREAIGSHVTGARPLLREIAREVERLKVITEDYLRFARLPRPALESLDLNLQCSELLDFVRAEYAEAHVALQLDLDPQPRLVIGDVNHTRSALLNLLRNAREALAQKEGGRVTLRVRSWGDEASVSVEDDGPGMSSEALERLFEPFFSTKPQGTGLGLAMVRQLMLAQGGRVEVKNQRAGGVAVSLFYPTEP